MSVPEAQPMSLRPGRFEYKRLACALGISLALHLFCFGGYEFGTRVLPDWLERVKFLAALAHYLRQHPNTPLPQPVEAPMVFVDVNPQVATPEPPKNAQYYSSQNSKAANPDADKDTDTPKITGQQTHVPKAEDAPRSNPDRLQPDFNALDRKLAAEQQKKPPPGDLTMAKPETTLNPETPQP